ncbi:GNAT family N-acetyltransferase [Paenibacillus nasutitermitis]|uniref:N-acetyltransferase domain-containing protein n=1 Tax=Paenibacillus nasutitermitis TaxID=1652958 RepID=A0A917DYV0_9BACL|nr:GNAT family N-acetyltransferase [Paenibacillus nasutitermitis]GGD83085.1 hypothetical protein GCM10010911_46610 [Paenibacillus nasutitermitis]
MIIRTLEPDDPAIVQNFLAEHPLAFLDFIRRKYPERWNQFLATRDFRRSGYYVMLDENGDIIGHAGYLFNEEVHKYEIVGVAARVNQQRRGVGKTLLHTICSTLADLGAAKVILYTLDHPPHTASALAFYRGIGFECTLHEQDYFRRDYHRVTFEKKLTKG